MLTVAALQLMSYAASVYGADHEGRVFVQLCRMMAERVEISGVHASTMATGHSAEAEEDLRFQTHIAYGFFNAYK